MMSFITSISGNAAHQVRNVDRAKESHEEEAQLKENARMQECFNKIREIVNEDPTHLVRTVGFGLRTNSKKNGLLHNPDFRVQDPQSELGNESYVASADQGLSLVSLDRLFQGGIPSGNVFVSKKMENMPSEMPDLLALTGGADGHYSLSLNQEAPRKNLEEALAQCRNRCFLDTEKSIELENAKPGRGIINPNQYSKNANHITGTLLGHRALEFGGEEFTDISDQIQRVHSVCLEYFPQQGPQQDLQQGSEQEAVWEEEMMRVPEGMVESQEDHPSSTSFQAITHQSERATILTNTLDR